MAEEKKDTPPPADDKKDTTPPADEKKDAPPPADDKKAADAKDKGDGEKKADAKAPGTDDGKPGGKDGDRKDGEPKAPEKYTLTLPEGGRITEAELTDFVKMANTQGWTKEEAQAYVDDRAASLHRQSETFLEETRADPDYGGDKLAETQKLAMAILDRVRPAGTKRGDALRGMLNRSGYGNNIEIISFLADLGRLGAEDTHVSGRRVQAPSKDAATVLYGGNA